MLRVSECERRNLSLQWSTACLESSAEADASHLEVTTECHMCKDMRMYIYLDVNK